MGFEPGFWWPPLRLARLRRERESVCVVCRRFSHMLAVEGAAPELAAAGGHEPLLTPEQVTLFGWGPQQATGFEREQIARLGVSVVEVDTVAADPAGAALRARTGIESRCDRLVVHFDVDVIDFTDVPLSENWGRNEGVSYEAAIRALRVLLESPKLSGLTVTELNPDHVEEGAGTLERFSCDLAASLSVRERKGDDG